MIALSRSFRFGPAVRVSTMSRSDTNMSPFYSQHVSFLPTSQPEIIREIALISLLLSFQSIVHGRGSQNNGNEAIR
jgi:hypothetical protein